jgi:two-component system, NarL family, nitrate/nitrite response regulator NarL
MTVAQTNPIRILLLDDHVVMRAGLRMLIASQPGLRVVAEAATGAEGLEVMRREEIDIVLLDLDLGTERGLDILPELRAAGHAQVIVLTGTRDSAEHLQAVRLGALGLVLKDHVIGDLVTAIRTVHAGEAWIAPRLLASLLGDNTRLPADDRDTTSIITLTTRERMVVALLCEGLKNRQIAERLSISETTVVHHLTSIFAKLGVANRLELVTYAYRHGLAKPR